MLPFDGSLGYQNKGGEGYEEGTSLLSDHFALSVEFDIKVESFRT